MPGSPKKRARRLASIMRTRTAGRSPDPETKKGVTHEVLRKSALLTLNALVKGASTEALRLGAAQVAFEELGRHDELAPEKQFFGLFPTREAALSWLGRELVPRLIASGELHIPPTLAISQLAESSES